MRLTRVELVPVLRYGWLVYCAGDVRFFEKKAAALKFARLTAKQHRGTLRIHDRKGRFQEERTYGPDPRRSKG